MLLFKKKSGSIKLRIYSKKANPSPPIGPSLGQKGLNISEFCKNFNDLTSKIDSSFLLPVLINYYSDKSYDFFIKNPTISFYLKKVIFNIDNFNNKNLKLNFFNILEIIKFKINDFNSLNLFSLFKIVLGVLKSIGKIIIFY